MCSVYIVVKQCDFVHFYEDGTMGLEIYSPLSDFNVNELAQEVHEFHMVRGFHGLLYQLNWSNGKVDMI